MKTMVKGNGVVVLNQPSYPETLDKHTAPGFVSGLVGCGAERYVLSGDCVPWPPLILRGRTHTERPCVEQRAGQTR